MRRKSPMEQTNNYANPKRRKRKTQKPKKDTRQKQKHIPPSIRYAFRCDGLAGARPQWILGDGGYKGIFFFMIIRRGGGRLTRDGVKKRSIAGAVQERVLLLDLRYDVFLCVRVCYIRYMKDNKTAETSTEGRNVKIAPSAKDLLEKINEITRIPQFAFASDAIKEKALREYPEIVKMMQG
jgi:hypothetical protein